jgi:hypothetical protein
MRVWVGRSCPIWWVLGCFYARFFSRVTVKFRLPARKVTCADEMSVLKPLGKRVGAQLPDELPTTTA